MYNLDLTGLVARLGKHLHFTFSAYVPVKLLEQRRIIQLNICSFWISDRLRKRCGCPGSNRMITGT